MCSRRTRLTRRVGDKTEGITIFCREGCLTGAKMFVAEFLCVPENFGYPKCL